MQSENDLLKQENTRLMARINELEQIVKEKDELENIEKQNRPVTNDLKSLEYSTPLPNKSCSNGENVQIKDSSTHHKVEQSMTSTDLVTSEQVVNTISNTSNLNETCSGKSKSLEDKEIGVFLDSENKKRDKAEEYGEKAIT
ncbi:6920_t:CDS:2 [Paraglomus brasilianum]|uniref:6920_t:CDS:1 n=1 Tax=Paraglomus brasilianum TaxID=144538 RepID=A0A9N9C9T8_9GLOM|nr:6920_t:CDS:2 [Paraglomus brasilianum]